MRNKQLIVRSQSNKEVRLANATEIYRNRKSKLFENAKRFKEQSLARVE